MNDIVVGVDTSDTARIAAEKAAYLAAKCDVNLHLVMCIGRGRIQDVGVGNDTWHIDATSEADTFLHDLARALPHDRITCGVEVGDPATALCAEAARLDALMIVVGNRRVQSVSRVLGSIAGDVAKQAPCDVLIANTMGG